MRTDLSKKWLFVGTRDESSLLTFNDLQHFFGDHVLYNISYFVIQDRSSLSPDQQWVTQQWVTKWQSWNSHQLYRNRAGRLEWHLTDVHYYALNKPLLVENWALLYVSTGRSRVTFTTYGIKFSTAMQSNWGSSLASLPTSERHRFIWCNNWLLNYGA